VRRRPSFRIPPPPELDSPPPGIGHNQPHLPFDEFRRRLAEECRIPRLIPARDYATDYGHQYVKVDFGQAGPVFNFVIRRCRTCSGGRWEQNYQNAADVVGNTAIVALEKWQTFNPEAPCKGKDPFRSWLFKIAQNQYKQFVRKAPKTAQMTEKMDHWLAAETKDYPNRDPVATAYLENDTQEWRYAQELPELRKTIDCAIGALYAEHIKVSSWSAEVLAEVMVDLQTTLRLAYVKAGTPEEKAEIGSLMLPVDRFNADAWEREIAGHKMTKAERDKGLKKAQREEAKLRGEPTRGSLASRKSRAKALAAE
jgi:DNA-directed RNA polymerase specialized sigma24 family protein